MMTGSRFAELVQDEQGALGDYVPRRLDAQLSPELQQALDEAFAPESDAPGPEPEGVRAEPEDALAEPAEITPPEPEIGLTVPEIALPEPEYVQSEREIDLPRSEDARPEPEDERPELEPVPALPEEVPSRYMTIHEYSTQQEFTLATPTPSSPDSPSFPDPAAYAARRLSGVTFPAPAAGPVGLFARRKVDRSRLIV